MDDTFLVALSKPEPVPGGGAAAAHGACVGLALVEKIIRLERRRKQTSTELLSLWEHLLERASDAARNLRLLRDEDGMAYMRLAEARASGRGKEPVAATLELAIECPIRIMEQACRGLDVIFQAGKHCKGHLLSDLLVSGDLLMAAIKGARHIALANLRLTFNLSLKSDYEKKLDQLKVRCQELSGLVEKEITGRITRSYAKQNQ